MSTHYSTDELEALVSSFEACSLPPADFDHRAHMAVAAWYLSHMTVEQAGARMREGLLRFIAHNKVDPQKYNETITQFWVKRLESLLREADSRLAFIDRANQAIERAGDSALIFEYYSRERVFTEEGRKAWLEPDLKRFED
jgi:hypothetical protein